MTTHILPEPEKAGGFMIKGSVTDAMAFKLQLETDFITATGVPDRRYFSGLYSLPQESAVLWLNLNPGGDEETSIMLPDKEIAAGSHEFFDGHGTTSIETGKCLLAMFQNQSDWIRSVQGSNVIWRRSRDSNSIPINKWALETAPFLLKVLDYVKPRIIIFGGIGTFEAFKKSTGAKASIESDVIYGQYYGRKVRIFIKTYLTVPERGSFVCVAILHPSKRRWNESIDELRDVLKDIKLPLPILKLQGTMP